MTQSDLGDGSRNKQNAGDNPALIQSGVNLKQAQEVRAL
jgi:hypothetical protein